MCFVFLRVDINFNLKDQLATPLYFPLRGQKEGRNDRKRQEQRKKKDDANGSVPLKLLVFLSLFVPSHSSSDNSWDRGRPGQAPLSFLDRVLGESCYQGHWGLNAPLTLQGKPWAQSTKVHSFPPIKPTPGPLYIC